MNDPRRPPRFVPPPTGSESTGSRGPRNSPPVDPAYADQASAYGPTYGSYVPSWTPGSSGTSGGYEPNPTQQLPPYWQQDSAHDEFGDDGSAPPPHGPTTPRWLWVVASAAVLLVVALVIALVVANNSTTEQTAVEPLPPMPTPSSTLVPPTTTKRTPSSTVPRSTTPRSPTPTTGVPVPGAMQTVVYNVSGEGRAISVSYLDNGELIQTEFNVALPWHKEVSLPQSSARIPSVTIINIGHNVTCSLTVAGVQVRQRTGVGLTICEAPA